MNRRLSLPTMLGCVLVVAATACGGAEEVPTKVPAQASAADQSRVDTIEGTNEPAAADPGEAVEIAFTVDAAGIRGPDSAPAGWVRILFDNKGQIDRHMALVRLTGGKTADDLEAHIRQDPKAPLPEWALQSGGPADISPGVSVAVTQNLQKGSHVWVSYVLADDEIARPGSDTMRPFTVTASSISGTEPTADMILTILEHDYSLRDTRDRFERRAASESGPRIVKVTNQSDLVHETRIVAIEGGKQAQDFPDLYYMSPKGRVQAKGVAAPLAPFPVIGDDGTGPGGPPPGTAIGGVMALQPGQTAYLAIDLKPGWYFVYDMLEDAELQLPYLFRPMILEFAVR